MIFTVEETTLAAAFDHSSRSAAVMDMMARLGMIDDKELREQVSRLKDKLNTMNDEEFMKVDFSGRRTLMFFIEWTQGHSEKQKRSSMTSVPGALRSVP